jgi:hypothetical protein
LPADATSRQQLALILKELRGLLSPG